LPPAFFTHLSTERAIALLPANLIAADVEISAAAKKIWKGWVNHRLSQIFRSSMINLHSG
jgi:hypothetical protein